jgi:hypothetical protein
MTAIARDTGRGPRLLPPFARPRDWLPAGVGAGLCLGAAEALALLLQGVELSPGRALALVATDVLVVALPCVPIALGIAISGARIRHSALVGGVVGPILLAPVWPRALAQAMAGFSALPPELPAGLALALAAGVLAAWAGSRLERAGIPIFGPPLWAAVALLVAGAGVFREDGPVQATPVALLGVLAAVVILALLAAVLAAVGARRETVVPWPWSRTLVALAALAAAMALAPRLLPWVLMEPEARGVRPRSPHLVVVDLGSFQPGKAPAVRQLLPNGSGEVAPNLTLLASAGVLYPRVLVVGEDSAAASGLRLPDGTPLAHALAARGYLPRIARDATAAEAIPAGFEGSTTSGSEAAANVQATVGGALLAAIGAGIDAPATGAPPAAAITAEARRRIAAARSIDSERPLLLLVDYRGAARDATALDDEVGALAGFVADLGLDENTRMVVTWTEDLADGRHVEHVVLRPEASAARAHRGVVVEELLLPEEVVERIAGFREDAPAPPPEAAP